MEKVYLRISRIRVKYIREKFAGARNSSNDQPMDIETVNDKEVGQREATGAFFLNSRVGIGSIRCIRSSAAKMLG